MKYWFAIVVMLCATTTQAWEVRVHPGVKLFLYPSSTEATRAGLYTGVIQNIAVVNTGPQPSQLESLKVTAFKDSQPLGSVSISISEMEEMAQKFSKYDELGVLQMYDFQFQTEAYLPGVQFATDRNLEPNHALVISSVPMLFIEQPDHLLIEAVGQSASGARVSSQSSLQVIVPENRGNYIFPLTGRWYIGGAPSLHSHHRWGTIQEFAFDMVQVGASGYHYQDEGTRLSDHYAYGKDVVSIADGQVVAAVDGREESSANLQQTGESDEEYFERTVARQQELLAKGVEYAFGNYVIIEHEGSEFSYTLHLKTGSVRVKRGDVIKQGQVLGQVGHSGNSDAPHLHFHLADGPELTSSRSIPIFFSNVKNVLDQGESGALQSGDLVITK